MAMGAVRRIQERRLGHGQALNLFGHVRAGHNIHRIGNVASSGRTAEYRSACIHFRVQLGGMRGERDDARIRHGLPAGVEIRMRSTTCALMVVKATRRSFVSRRLKPSSSTKYRIVPVTAQADLGTVLPGIRGVVAQMRCGGFGSNRVFGRQHRVDHGNQLPCASVQLIRTVIRLTVAVFQNIIASRPWPPRSAWRSVTFCALSFKGTLFIRHKC